MQKLILIAFLVPTFAFADGPGPKTWEIQSAPSAGYSSFGGLRVGLDNKFRYTLDPNWQLEFGFGIYANKYRSLRDYSVGVNYNFSEDWSRSWFMGAGLGYVDGNYVSGSGSRGGNEDGANGSNTYSDRNTYLYINAGKRFRLNDAGTITWNPYVQLAALERGPATISIVPLSFGFSF